MNYDELTKEELKDLVQERGLSVAKGTGQGGSILKSDLVTVLEYDDAEEEEEETVEFEDSELHISDLKPEERYIHENAVPPGHLYVELTPDAPDAVFVAGKMYGTGQREFRKESGPHLVTQLEYDSLLNRGGAAKYFMAV